MKQQHLIYKKKLMRAYSEALTIQQQGKLKRPLTQQRAEIIAARLQQIERALDRLHHGEFGICQHCGDEIQKRRLTLLPYTERCVNCQREQEHVQSGKGMGISA